MKISTAVERQSEEERALIVRTYFINRIWHALTLFESYASRLSLLLFIFAIVLLLVSLPSLRSSSANIKRALWLPWSQDQLIALTRRGKARQGNQTLPSDKSVAAISRPPLYAAGAVETVFMNPPARVQLTTVCMLGEQRTN